MDAARERPDWTAVRAAFGTARVATLRPAAPTGAIVVAGDVAPRTVDTSDVDESRRVDLAGVAGQ